MVTEEVLAFCFGLAFSHFAENILILKKKYLANYIVSSK